MMEALQWKLLVLSDEPLGAQSSEQVPRRPQPMMPLAQLRASWKELPSSLAGSSSFAGSTAAVTAFGTSGADGAEAPSFGGVFGASAFGGVFGPSIFGGSFGTPQITTDGGFGASPFGGGGNDLLCA